MEILRRRCYTDTLQLTGLRPDKIIQLYKSIVPNMASPGKDQNSKYSFQQMCIAFTPLWSQKILSRTTVSRGLSINLSANFYLFIYFFLAGQIFANDAPIETCLTAEFWLTQKNLKQIHYHCWCTQPWVLSLINKHIPTGVEGRQKKLRQYWHNLLILCLNNSERLVNFL